MQMSDLEIINKFKRQIIRLAILRSLRSLTAVRRIQSEIFCARAGSRKMRSQCLKANGRPATERLRRQKEKVDESTKNGSVFEEEPELTEEEQRMLDKALSIPVPVVDAVLSRLNKLKKKIQKYEQECETLEAFIEGEI